MMTEKSNRRKSQVNRFEQIMTVLRRRGLIRETQTPLPLIGERIGDYPAALFGKPATDHGWKDGAYVHPVPPPKTAMRTDLPNWQHYYMQIAKLVATKSKDSTQVGAVLVGPEGEIRLTAYNGPPRGVKDLPERFERPAKYLYAMHAEAGLVAFAAREGIRTKGCTVYSTHQPCAACSRSLIQAGIKTIYFCDGAFGKGSAMIEEMKASSTMLVEAGVETFLLP